MNIRILLALSMLAFSPVVSAQDSVDLHGFQLVPSDGDLHDGLSTWRGETHEAGSVGFNGLFEYAAQPLVHYGRTGDTVTRTILIDDLAAVNLGAFYAPHKRLSLTAAAPLYLAVDNSDGQTGAGLGDVRVASSVGILLPREDRVSLGLSVVPFLDIPGFYSTRSQLGLNGFAGGGLVAVSVGDDRWDLSGNVGVQFTPSVNYFNLEGEERLVSAVSAAYSLSEDVALRGEWTFRPTLHDNEQEWTDSPMEAGLSLKGHTGDNLGWTFGGATALDQGSGAATWRVFAGLDLAFGARHEPASVVCYECGNAELMVRTIDPSGKTVDVPIEISNGDLTFELESEDMVVLPEGIYLLDVTVPDCEPPLVVIEGGKLLLIEPIYFDFDKSSIRFPESSDILNALVQTLDEHQELLLVSVDGHTDERGSHEYNEDLSQRRMNSVVNYLVEHGIDADRLSPVGYGERHLLDEDCGSDEECHQLNRRVEFTILKSE